MDIFDILKLIGGLCLFLFSRQWRALRGHAAERGIKIIGDLERTSDHCANIAECILDGEHHLLPAHHTLHSSKELYDKHYAVLADRYL